jgi:RNA polymerase sigma-70 factor (ECF subfamily)
MSSEEERQLVRDALSGDREAFASLVRGHEVRVRSLCLSILRNPAEADDAAQDVFIKAYKSLSSFRFESSLSTWLYRIAHRRCLDLLRSGARRRTEPLDALDSGLLQEKAPPERGDAERILAVLSPEERLVLTLREVQGLSYEEMAAVLETTLDGVKGRLKRARRTLRLKARHLFEPADVKMLKEATP